MKIAIVEDSLTALAGLRLVFDNAPEHEIVWEAKNGAEAVKKCRDMTPDLILMDLMMPVMNGIDATRRIMQSTPCAILVVTATVSGNPSMVFEAMGAGALDAVSRPVIEKSGQIRGAQALLDKISRIGKLIGVQGSGTTVKPTAVPMVKSSPIKGRATILAIGCSTGGPNALLEILSLLPTDFPAAVIVIQHMDQKFTPGLIKWLNEQVPLPVEAIRNGMKPTPGRVLVASTNDHLLLTHGNRLQYTREPIDNCFHPSVDVFFESMAPLWEGAGLGILLTGMGRDGAKGLLKLRQHGWHTIAQDEASSVVFGMPKAAIDIGAAHEVLSIEQIGPSIINRLMPRKGIRLG